VALWALHSTGAGLVVTAAALGRPLGAIQARRRLLGMTTAKAPRWTTQEEWRLRGLLEEGLSDAVIAARLGRGVDGVRHRAARLGYSPSWVGKVAAQLGLPKLGRGVWKRRAAGAS